MGALKVSFPKPCAEPWEDMSPAGCNRHCASCDRIIFDLAELTIDEAEALLSKGDEVCVRAELNAQGGVKLKSDAWANARRMIATVGAGAGLLAVGSAAFAKNSPVDGSIAGKVENFWLSGTVTATRTDGQPYRAKIKRSGKYKVKHLPPGSYAMQFDDWCSEGPWQGGTVEVKVGETTRKDTKNPNGCIIVGQLKIEEHTG